MAKLTVQGLLYDKVEGMDKKLDKVILVVEGLKVKAAIAGGIAGLVGTAIVSAAVAFIR